MITTNKASTVKASTVKASTVKASTVKASTVKPTFDWSGDDPALLSEEELQKRAVQFAAEKRLSVKVVRKQGERRQSVNVDGLAFQKALEYAEQDNPHLYEMVVVSDPNCRGRASGTGGVSDRGEVQSAVTLRGIELLLYGVTEENRASVLKQALAHQRSIGYAAILADESEKALS